MLSAVNVSDVPLPESEPSMLLDRAQVYEMPVPGHVVEQTGVAVKLCGVPADTVGVRGDTLTEASVTLDELTDMLVNAEPVALFVSVTVTSTGNVPVVV